KLGPTAARREARPTISRVTEFCLLGVRSPRYRRAPIINPMLKGIVQQWLPSHGSSVHRSRSLFASPLPNRNTGHVQSRLPPTISPPRENNRNNSAGSDSPMLGDKRSWLRLQFTPGATVVFARFSSRNSKLPPTDRRNDQKLERCQRQRSIPGAGAYGRYDMAKSAKAVPGSDWQTRPRLGYRPAWYRGTRNAHQKRRRPKISGRRLQVILTVWDRESMASSLSPISLQTGRFHDGSDR